MVAYLLAQEREFKSKGLYNNCKTFESEMKVLSC